jgi:hypothetical protein
MQMFNTQTHVQLCTNIHVHCTVDVGVQGIGGID